jgi:GNAT superfamily N-acetyltransferase
MSIRLINNNEFDFIKNEMANNNIIQFDIDFAEFRKYKIYSSITFHFLNNHIYTFDDDVFKGFIVYNNEKCHLIWIKPEFRNKGYGTKLIKYFDISIVNYIPDTELFWKKYGFMELNGSLSKNMMINMSKFYISPEYSLLLPITYYKNLKKIENILKKHNPKQCQDLSNVLNYIYLKSNNKYLYIRTILYTIKYGIDISYFEQIIKYIEMINRIKMLNYVKYDKNLLIL